MIILQGKYNYALVYTDNFDEETKAQIINLLNQEFVKGAKIRIMPDTHAGAGCVIGFTADLGDKVVPNLVGVDIGCGMFVVDLWHMQLDLEQLDRIIHSYIPAGREVHSMPYVIPLDLTRLRCWEYLKNRENFYKAVGTLGGGNHFIEVDKDQVENRSYLVIHSGSRNLGKQVADYYQQVAIHECSGVPDVVASREELILDLKKKGKQKDIQKKLKEYDELIKNIKPIYPKELCFVTGKNREDYLHDMKICQEYASMNRKQMATIILNKILGIGSGLVHLDSFETVHNYIDFESNVVRKGAVSARFGERLLIPINMRDGSLLAKGLGNTDWNESAPHGAGRLMGRNVAKATLSLDTYKAQMKGIYSTTVNQSTLDEAPDAYRTMEEIYENTKDTVEVTNILKPIYNFKSME